jgi:hypothetical protein
MKLAGNVSHFSNPQHQLCYTFGCLVAQAFAQVEANITDNNINLADVPALITVLKTVFWDPDHVATAEGKLEELKQTNSDFSSYYAEFQYYTTDVQWNDPEKCTALMGGLNNEIKDALALFDKVPQQFQEFVAFLKWLNNQIRAQEVKKKGKQVPQNTNIIP